jgi:hypothetical protein
MTEKKTQNERLLRIMNELILVLEPLESDSTMRQILLETQWLKQNLLNGHLILPKWRLLIFKQPRKLLQNKTAALKAKELADELEKYQVSVAKEIN